MSGCADCWTASGARKFPAKSQEPTTTHLLWVSACAGVGRPLSAPPDVESKDPTRFAHSDISQRRVEYHCKTRNTQSESRVHRSRTWAVTTCACLAPTVLGMCLRFHAKGCHLDSLVPCARTPLARSRVSMIGPVKSSKAPSSLLAATLALKKIYCISKKIFTRDTPLICWWCILYPPGAEKEHDTVDEESKFLRPCFHHSMFIVGPDVVCTDCDSGSCRAGKN